MRIAFSYIKIEAFSEWIISARRVFLEKINLQIAQAL